MIKIQPYIPILKSRQAEEKALKDLSEDEKKYTMPLFQIVHKYDYIKNHDGSRTRYERPKEKVLHETLSKIKDLSSFSKIFVDSRPLFSSNSNEILTTISRTQTTLFGNNIVPVLTLTDIKEIDYGKDVLDFIKKQGICLRVFKDQINDYFWNNIDSLLNKLQINRRNTDLIFDFKVTDESDLEQYLKEIKRDENSTLWRLYYFVSGNFPMNLMEYPKPDRYSIIRKDWLLWKKIFVTTNGIRKLGFGDYTIQHPIYNLPIENSNPSRSIIYAKDEEWILMKGQNDKAKNSSKAHQYYAHAVILTRYKLIYGGSCCKGDLKIMDVSKNPNGNMGGFSTWLRVGINHHISLTLRQIASLH